MATFDPVVKIAELIPAQRAKILRHRFFFGKDSSTFPWVFFHEMEEENTHKNRKLRYPKKIHEKLPLVFHKKSQGNGLRMAWRKSRGVGVHCFFLILRIFQHTPGTYPRPPINSLCRNSFHLGGLGCLGYAPGVCWSSLRLIHPRKLTNSSPKKGRTFNRKYI